MSTFERYALKYAETVTPHGVRFAGTAPPVFARYPAVPELEGIVVWVA